MAGTSRHTKLPRILLEAMALILAGAFLACNSYRVPDDFLTEVPDAEAIGLVHEVQAGETLAGICRRYGADVQEVAEINGILDSSQIRKGQRIFVPDVSGPASKPTENAVPPNVRTTEVQHWPGQFIWPVDGVVTSQFGVRWGRRHDGIDIASPQGTPVKAAAGGRVLFAGEQGGYGNLLILSHENRMITIYAHNRVNLVKEGDSVARGQVIAEVGQTGRATGPHVHFEIREGKKARNPMFFLPRPEP